MKSRYVWSTSVFVFLVAVTLAYQNCSNKKFADTAGSSIAGALNSIDGNGNTQGEVIIKNCQADVSTCPDSVQIKFYAIDDDASKELIGEVEADKAVNNEGAIVYRFSFVVQSKYACFTIKAYAVEPVTKIEIEIPYSPTFQSASFEEKCDDGPVNPPPGSGNPLVDIVDVKKDGRLIEVNAKCAVGADVNFTGDINSLIDNKESCSSGVIKHCNLINKYNNDNTVEGKQSLNGKLASDSAVVRWTDQPIKVITYDSFKVDADEKNITITGRCNPADIVVVSAYGGATSGQTTCTSVGTYSIKAPILIPSLKNKGREVTGMGKASAVVGGNTPTIIYDPDKDLQPTCSITSMVPNASMCSKQAATIKGSCLKNLPVIASVNGSMQNIGYCSSAGTFEIKNVLLKDTGINNSVKIEQSTPYGKVCSDTKSLMNF